MYRFIVQALSIALLAASVNAQDAELSGADLVETETTVFFRWIDQLGRIHYTDFEPSGIPSQQVEMLELEEMTDADEAPMLRSASNGRRSDPFHDQDQQILPIEHIGPCADARQQLAVLYAELPVYQEQGGAFRTAWRGDTYRGERRYLAADERQTAIAAVRTEVLTSCSDPQAFQSEEAAFKDALKDTVQKN